MYIKFKIKNREIEFNTKSKYFVTEIKTIDDIRFDCNRYTDELVKQIHIDNIFHMIQNGIRPFMVLTSEELVDFLKTL